MIRNGDTPNEDSKLDTNVSKTEDPWTLMSAKRYAEAAEEFSRRHAEGGNPVGGLTILLRGRAWARMLTGRPAEALADLRTVIETTPENLRNTTDLIAVGTCHWSLRQPEEAVAAWRQSLKAPYRDAAGGVVSPAILLYAGVRWRQPKVEAEGLRLLRGHWKKFQRRVQRGPATTAASATTTSCIRACMPGRGPWCRFC